MERRHHAREMRAAIGVLVTVRVSHLQLLSASQASVTAILNIAAIAAHGRPAQAQIAIVVVQAAVV